MPVASQVMHPILSLTSNCFLSVHRNEEDKTQLAEDAKLHQQGLTMKSKQHSPLLYKFITYSIIQNDCQGFNNLSYTIHLR